MFVRIKPASPCDSYNQFFKARGWHKVDADVAEWCRTRRINDLTPDAPLVFDVVDEIEAKVVVDAETKRAEPAGTVDAPIDFTTKSSEAKAEQKPSTAPSSKQPGKPEAKAEQKPSTAPSSDAKP